jgi:DinB superfamily
MSGKLYPYVGPEEIRCRSVTGPGGRVIESPEDLRMWLNGHRPSKSGELIAATFVIDPQGRLRLADRRSEHVACAGGGPVLSAGEMFFSDQGDAAFVEEVTNLSTGYCPEPESWPVVGHALDRLGVVHPGLFTTEVILRLCATCGERNVVKEGWFSCQVCSGELPRMWNFGTGRSEMETSTGTAEAPYKYTITTVRDTLISVFSQVEAWFDRPSEVRAFRPPDGGWTIDEVLEHVTLTNHFLLLVIRKSTGKALARAARQGPVAEGESDLRLLDPIGERGSFPWARPAHMIPAGRSSSDEVRSLMREQIRECFDILRRLGGGEGSLHRVRMSVNECGRLDVYQWLQFLALHAHRHLAQMSANEVAWRAETRKD